MADTEEKEQPKNILILKSNPMALQSSEQFLRSRGWNVIPAIKLAEAIQALFQRPVDYFLICANHPQKKVRALPKILAQIGSVRVITYTDIANTLNMTILQEMGVPYQIIPPVSGPAIERTIIRMEKDLLNPKDPLKKVGTKESFSFADSSATGSSMRDQFRAFFANDNEDGSGNFDFAFMPQQEGQLEGESFAQYEERMKQQRGAAFVNNSPLPPKPGDPGFANGIHSNGNQGGPAFANNGSTNENAGGPAFASNSTNNDPQRGPAFASNHTTNENQGGPAFAGNDSTNTKATGGFQFFNKEEKATGPAFTNRKQAVQAIRKGVEDALENSLRASDPNTPVQKLDASENCICLSVDAGRFRGYLVAAMGKNRRFDDELLMTIQSRLLQFLQKEGVNMDGNETMEITIKPVDFESWAVDKADFLKKSIHDGNEVAMAFFPTEKTAPTLGESRAEDMMSLDIDELANDVVVPFDVYIHLPANDKYILYTPKGGTFMKTQKDRLKSKGIEKMHAKKEAASDIKKYHAENTLNNSIQDFESKVEESKKKAR
jgi:hypothetical protein